jgi:hypothetical protein
MKDKIILAAYTVIILGVAFGLPVLAVLTAHKY